MKVMNIRKQLTFVFESIQTTEIIETIPKILITQLPKIGNEGRKKLK